MSKRFKKKVVSFLLVGAVVTGIYGYNYFFGLPNEGESEFGEINDVEVTQQDEITGDEYSNEDESTPYLVVNDNKPSFTENEKQQTEEYKRFSSLDALGRCGSAEAVIGPDLLPTEERGSIGMVKPSGWHTARYDDIIADKYLYNRCHLIAFSLCGENANEQNLITGTRYMNTEGMLPFEMEVLDYVRETGNHVVYRVTPIFKGKDLVARGVRMEAYSVEDKGKGISFNVYCKNIQPGIEIDYATGESKRK